MQVGQLDGVADLLDLVDQAPDRLVGDVGDLLQHELLDLGLRDPLVDVAGPALEQQRVAGPDGVGQQRRGEPDDPLLVGVGDDERPLAVLEQLLEHHHLADLLEVERGDDVERLVEHDLLAAAGARPASTAGAHVHAQLAPAGEHVDRVVLVAAQEGAEAGRRLGEPVDLLLELHDLVAGLAQGLGQALVLRGDPGEGTLRVGQPELEAAREPGRVAQPAAQVGDLRLQEAHLAR